MSSDTPITKTQLTLIALVILLLDIFALRASVELLRSFDLSPILLWATFGALIAVQVCTLLWVRLPSPEILSRRREEIFVLLTGFVYFPIWSLTVLLSIGLDAPFPNGSQILFVLCMLSAFNVLPLAVFLHILNDYRIPYYAARCTKCLYDLSAVEADSCPECNTPITRLEDPTTLSSHPAHSQAAQDTDQAAPP